MTAKTKQPPAKARYDLKSPRVTFRLPKEYVEKLDSRSTARGISHTDFMKRVLNGKEQEISHDGGYAKGRKDGYDDGYQEGCVDGQEYEEQQNKEAVIGKPSGKSEEIPGQGFDLIEDGISFEMTLPPVAFTLFAAAKAAKLVDEDMDFDHWVFECILTRFELDYCLRLMLVNMEETG